MYWFPKNNCGVVSRNKKKKEEMDAYLSDQKGKFNSVLADWDFA